MPWKHDLQPPISPLPELRRNWFSGKISCQEEGWTFWRSYSGGGRIDAYHYEENGRGLTLGGEGGDATEDIIVSPNLYWDDDLSNAIDPASVRRILLNITSAIQWIGSSVYFSYEISDAH